MKSPGDVCASQGVTNLEKVGCMSNLSVFDFNRNPVRVVVQDGEPWFVASDLCQVLEIRNTSDALSRLDDEEKAIATADTPGGKQSVSIVSESGMYSLVLTSRKAEAKAFKRWITGTVLPEIRKTGSYNGGKGQAEGCPDWFYRLRVFRRHTKIPAGWFCIFEEIAELMGDFEEAGYSLPLGSIPDISVGKCFAQHLRDTNVDCEGMVEIYQHVYPDGRIVDARIYADALLPEFRRWFGKAYRVNQLKNYLQRKDPQALPILKNILDAYDEAEQKLIS